MRNKIKEIMNKEEGFTLVELLAVIVILGIIVAIAIPAIGSITSTARTNADKAEQELVIDAARLYFTTEQPTEDSVDTATLIKDGYLEERGDTDTDPAQSITVYRHNNNGNVTYSTQSEGTQGTPPAATDNQ